MIIHAIGCLLLLLVYQVEDAIAALAALAKKLRGYWEDPE